jgi:hypothetical protein
MTQQQPAGNECTWGPTAAKRKTAIHLDDRQQAGLTMFNGLASDVPRAHKQLIVDADDDHYQGAPFKRW